ncbi:hypothetical protein C8R47DRAFT_68272 [Mycena vitilis]|nr:hypothetical protein C8R47DRAFT_68272 [Mycena vitilis]
MLGRACAVLRPRFTLHLPSLFSSPLSQSASGSASALASQSAHSRPRRGTGLRTEVRASSGVASATTAPPNPGKPGKKFYNVCKNCRRLGHMFWNCSEPIVCAACGAQGHRRSQCPNPDRKRLRALKTLPKKCFRCGEEGHAVKECTAAYVCFECGEAVRKSYPLCYFSGSIMNWLLYQGHLRENCPRIQYAYPPLNCRRCGEKGHYQRDCTTELKRRRPQEEAISLPNDIRLDTDPAIAPLRPDGTSQPTLSEVRQRLKKLK